MLSVQLWNGPVEWTNCVFEVAINLNTMYKHNSTLNYNCQFQMRDHARRNAPPSYTGINGVSIRFQMPGGMVAHTFDPTHDMSVSVILFIIIHANSLSDAIHVWYNLRFVSFCFIKILNTKLWLTWLQRTYLILTQIEYWWVFFFSGHH